MTAITDQDIATKKTAILTLNVAAATAQVSAISARNAVGVAQAELNEMQAQKQLDDMNAQQA